VLPALPGQAGSRLDLRGAASLALGLVALVLPMVQGRDAGWPLWSLACLAASPLLLALFWRQQRTLAARGGQPLVTPALFAQPGFVLGLLVTLSFYAGNASFYFVLALYLQQGLGLAPLPSGLMFSVLAGAFFATSMASPRFAKRWGRHAISIGALLLAAGHALMLGIVVASPAGSGVSAIAVALLVQGSGLGMVMAPLVARVLAGMPAACAGVASGALATVQQVGNALGVALIGIVFYGSHGAMTPQGSAAGFARSLLYLCGLALGVFILYKRFGRVAAASTRDPP
jgi:predicted MFS family arabinose efflux permease